MHFSEGIFGRRPAGLGTVADNMNAVAPSGGVAGKSVADAATLAKPLAERLDRAFRDLCRNATPTGPNALASIVPRLASYYQIDAAELRKASVARGCTVGPHAGRIAIAVQFGTPKLSSPGGGAKPTTTSVTSQMQQLVLTSAPPPESTEAPPAPTATTVQTGVQQPQPASSGGGGGILLLGLAAAAAYFLS